MFIFWFCLEKSTLKTQSKNSVSEADLKNFEKSLVLNQGKRFLYKRP